MTFWTLWWSSFKLTSNKRFCLWTLSLFILTLTNSFLPGQFIELTDHPYKSCNTFSNVCCQYFALFVAISDANPFSYFNSFDFLVMELPTLKKSSISLTVQLSGTKVKYFNWFILSENLTFSLNMSISLSSSLPFWQQQTLSSFFSMKSLSKSRATTTLPFTAAQTC